jgi:hypothetical protein
MLVITGALFALVGATRSADFRAALQYLELNRPPRDEALPLRKNVLMALDARASSRWACEVPWDVFCDAVLPYACLDEPRDRHDVMRTELSRLCLPMVKGVATPGEAACVLNREIWSALGVEFRPNLSPRYLSPHDVVTNGAASCSGLSLLLVAACRAVGVPARCAGVMDWGDGSGNHVWVEVWSGGSWHSLGAAEPSELSDTWFADRLRRADAPPVFASTFSRECGTPPVPDEAVCFPLPWRIEDERTESGLEPQGTRKGGSGIQVSGTDHDFVPAVDVTGRYRQAK